MALRTIAATQANISAEELLAGLEIKQELGGDFITVALATGDPKAVQQLVVTHVEKAMEEFRRNRARSSVAAGKFLDAELATAEKELEAARGDLLRFQLNNSLQNLEREIQAEQDAIRTLRTAQESAAIEMARLATVAEESDKQSEQALTKAAAATPNSTAAIAWQQTGLNLAAEAMGRRVEMAGQRAALSSYVTQIGQHEANLASLLTLTSRHQQLTDALTAKLDTRDFLVNKAREAQLKESQSLAVGYLQVVGETSVPAAPIPTRTLQIALFGGALSLLAGLILAFVLEFLEQALRRPATRQRIGVCSWPRRPSLPVPANG